MRILTVFALLWVGLSGQAPPGRLRTDGQCLPRDEAVRKPDFFSFRAQLQMAVARRDLQAVLAATDPGIKTSFGKDEGLADFKRELSDPSGELWKELASVLALGGWFEDDLTFRAPYIGACEGGDVIVIGRDVRVRSAPSVTAPTLASVSFAVLQGQWADGEWYVVQFEGGSKGFVAAALARSPMDYRAAFKRVRGLWKITVFIAGD